MEKKKNVYRAAIGVVVLEIIMKIIAFVKQSVVAYYFGANGQTDVYFVANDFMVSVSETLIGAAKVAIIGIYTSVCIKEGRKSGNELMSRFALLVMSFAFLLVILINCLALPLAKILAPSFSAAQESQLALYISYLSGIVIFTSLIMIFESVLNSNEIFMVSRIRSFIYSVCVIVACVAASRQGIAVLIKAQYTSFVIYLLVQMIASKSYFKFSLCNPIKDRYVNNVLKLMMPIILGNSIIRINYLIDKAVASSLEDGAVSALAYCQILDQFVVGVIVNSICSVMFSHFANLVVEDKKDEINMKLDNTLCGLSLILIPVMIIVIMSADEIVEIVFCRGNFSQEMAKLTALPLMGYAIRYFFVAIRDVVIQVLYAYKETKFPMLNSLICTILNIIISLLGVKTLGIFAIALGTSVSAFAGMSLNIYIFRKYNKHYKFENVLKIVIHSLPVSVVCISSCWLINTMTEMNVFLCFVVKTVIVFVIYYAGLLVQKDKKTMYFCNKILK